MSDNRIPALISGLLQSILSIKVAEESVTQIGNVIYGIEPNTIILLK